MTDQVLDPCKNVTQANRMSTGIAITSITIVLLIAILYMFWALLFVILLCSRCCLYYIRKSRNEDDQSSLTRQDMQDIEAAITRSDFEDPPTRGAIHNVVPEVRLEINEELDVVDEKFQNFVLPENVKEQIYERSKCNNENDHDCVCVICLEEYKEKETIRVVEPCNHLYHTYCIKKWLFNNNRSCPICRNHIPIYRSRYQR